MAGHDSCVFAASVAGSVGEDLSARFQFGTNQDLTDFMDDTGPLATVLPIGIRVHMLRQLLGGRVPAPLCECLSAPSAALSAVEPRSAGAELDTTESKLQKLWSCTLLPDVPSPEARSAHAAAASSDPTHTCTYHHAFPLCDLSDVKSMCVRAEAGRSTSVHLLTCSPYGCATYSLASAPLAPLPLPTAWAAPAPAAVPAAAPAALVPAAALAAHVLPHKNVSYPFSSAQGMLRWCVNTDSTSGSNNLHLTNGCLHVPSSVLVPKTPAEPPKQKPQSQFHTSSRGCGLGVSIASATDDIGGTRTTGGGGGASFRPQPLDDRAAIHGGGTLHIAAVLSCDVCLDGTSMAVLVEGYFAGGIADLSTRCAPAEGDSDVDSTSLSLGSGGMSDLRVFRQRIRSSRRGTRLSAQDITDSHSYDPGQWHDQRRQQAAGRVLGRLRGFLEENSRAADTVGMHAVWIVIVMEVLLEIHFDFICIAELTYPMLLRAVHTSPTAGAQAELDLGTQAHPAGQQEAGVMSVASDEGEDWRGGGAMEMDMDGEGTGGEKVYVICDGICVSRESPAVTER